MEFAQFGAAAAFITATCTMWRLFSEGRATRKAGKRLSYSVHVPSESTGRTGFWRKWLPGLRRRIGRTSLAHEAEMRLLVFLWNSGNEAIVGGDFFSEKSLRINMHNCRVVGAEIGFQSYSSVGASARVSTNSHEWMASLVESRAGSVDVNVAYLPPAHGVIVQISLRDITRKIPLTSVVGPIKGLRRITYVGSLISLPLGHPGRLRVIKSWIGSVVNVSLAGMGATFIFMIVAGVFSAGLPTFRYWLCMAVTLIFEMIYLLSRDVRAQLMYRVPDKLAYWDPMRCERDRS